MIEAYGEKALRVILFAFRDFDSEEECHQDEDVVVQDLVLQMFVGIQVRYRLRRVYWSVL